MRALCFGSLNIDYVYQVPHFVRGGETLSSAGMQVFSGGKGLNQSIALSRGGVEVYHAGAIGGDGTFLLEVLRQAGVKTALVKCIGDERTGHAIIQNNAEGDNCILLYGGANRRITRGQIDETLDRFSPGDVLVVQNEINAIDVLLERAKRRGMTVAMNPSPMTDDLKQLMPLVDILVLNEIEASQLLEEEARRDPPALANRLGEALPNTEIVLTCGMQGAYFIHHQVLLHQPAIAVKTVDTTAAGDTYLGFFLAGLLMGGTPEWAMRYAAHAAAIAVTKPGAAPSIPGRDDVLAVMADDSRASEWAGR